MSYDPDLARQIALELFSNTGDERGLDNTFIEVCRFLSENPEKLSIRGNKKPSVCNKDGLAKLATKFISGYRRDDTPSTPSTIPDEMVSFVLRQIHGYTLEDCEKIKVEHQHSMSAENCVGALLERYLDSVLRQSGWCWCCGDFVKAVDFIKRGSDDKWLLLQVKNRDNSENSSSSAIRNATPIQKWFRSFSRRGGTNWDNVPTLMQGYGLSEVGFQEFVKSYMGNSEVPGYSDDE